MQHYDVFNGDADGILALVQLRLADPKPSHLVTGVKRDIALLKQVDVQQASAVTVLDISMEKNTEALKDVLDANIDVFYVDHHRPGKVPVSDHLHALIDTDANTCTSLLVSEHLQRKYHLWAIAAAFGDNLKAVARQHCQDLGLTEKEQSDLEALGTYVNYNGYGRSVDDLHFHPADLFRELVKFDDPRDVINQDGSVFSQLERAYHDDMKNAEQAEVLYDGERVKVVRLEDAKWARRVSGVYGNELANLSPDRAHAVLTYNNDGSFTVSVRAPLNNKQGADEVCVQFPTGGGRAGAAGINALKADAIHDLIDALNAKYQ